MRQAFGLTLLELLVVVAIIAIMGTFGGPPVANWNCKRNGANEFESLIRLMSFAKSESLSRGISVGIPAQTSDSTELVLRETDRSCTSVSGDVLRSEEFNTSDISGLSSLFCFHPDGSSTGGDVELSKTCRGVERRYKVTVFQATSFMASELKIGSGEWQER